MLVKGLLGGLDGNGPFGPIYGLPLQTIFIIKRETFSNHKLIINKSLLFFKK